MTKSLAPTPSHTHSCQLLLGARPDLGEAIAEPGEHLLHVAPLLHGDDPQVVLLIDPHQEGLIVIVPGGGGGIVRPEVYPGAGREARTPQKWIKKP